MIYNFNANELINSNKSSKMPSNIRTSNSN